MRSPHPDHKSITNQVPAVTAAQGTRSDSPDPLHATGLAAAKRVAMEEGSGRLGLTWTGIPGLVVYRFEVSSAIIRNNLIMIQSDSPTN